MQGRCVCEKVKGQIGEGHYRIGRPSCHDLTLSQGPAAARTNLDLALSYVRDTRFASNVLTPSPLVHSSTTHANTHAREIVHSCILRRTGRLGRQIPFLHAHVRLLRNFSTRTRFCFTTTTPQANTHAYAHAKTRTHHHGAEIEVVFPEQLIDELRVDGGRLAVAPDGLEPGVFNVWRVNVQLRVCV